MLCWPCASRGSAASFHQSPSPPRRRGRFRKQSTCHRRSIPRWRTQTAGRDGRVRYGPRSRLVPPFVNSLGSHPPFSTPKGSHLPRAFRPPDPPPSPPQPSSPHSVPEQEVMAHRRHPHAGEDLGARAGESGGGEKVGGDEKGDRGGKEARRVDGPGRERGARGETGTFRVYVQRRSGDGRTWGWGWRCSGYSVRRRGRVLAGGEEVRSAERG